MNASKPRPRLKLFGVTPDSTERNIHATIHERQLQEQINQLLRALVHKESELDALRASKSKGF